MSKIIYISGPIGNGHTQGPRQMYENVRRAEKIMFELMKKGWTVICPHLSYHAWLNFPEDMPWQRWMQMDMDFINKVDALFHMIPEIYGPSKGTELEVIEAKRIGLQIYNNISQVPNLDPVTGQSL